MFLEFNHTLLAIVFNTPWMLLLGACGCLIPIALHLFNTKQNTVIEWAAMEFLIEAWAKVKRKTRLHNYALLAARCCIPLVVGLILSNPTTSTQTNTDKNPLYIIIDNGVVSNTIVTPPTTDLEINKQSAIDQIKQNQTHHQYFILATSDPAKHPTVFNNAQDALVHINNIKSTYMPTDIPGSLSKIQNHLHAHTSEPSRVYVASRFRLGSLASNQQTGPWPKGTTLNYSQPAVATVENIKINTILPLQGYRLNNQNTTEPTLDGVEIQLSTDTPTRPKEIIRIRINSENNNEQLETYWPPGEKYLTINVNLPGSKSNTTVQILNHDSLPEDNIYHLSLPIFNEIKTTIINRPDLDEEDLEKWLRLALKPHKDTPINISIVDPATIQRPKLKDAACVFLLRPELCNKPSWNELYNHVSNGGLLVIFPPPTNNPSPWVKPINEVFGLEIQTTSIPTQSNPPQRIGLSTNSNILFPTINTELNNLINPLRVNKHISLKPDPKSIIIFELENSDPAVIYNTPIQSSTGGVVVFSFSLNPTWTNFPTKPFMVPLTQELVRNSFESKSKHPDLHVGDTPNKALGGKDVSFIQQGSTRVSPTTQQNNQPQRLRTPGHWTAYNTNSKLINSLVVNINRKTTNTNPTTDKDIHDYLGKGWSQGEATQKPNPPHSLQGILVLLLITIIVIETILAKRISIKQPQQTTPPRGAV